VSNLVRKFISRIPALNRHCFLVTSHGQTASMWLAAVLNNIPEVFCSHGYTYPPRPAALHEITTDDLVLRDQSAARFNTLPVKKLFSEMREVTDKPIVGNVLAFYLGRLVHRMRNIEKYYRTYTIANVIRHPLVRLTSTLKTWHPPGEENVEPSFVPIDFHTRCTHIREFIAQSHQVDFTKVMNKSFVVCLLAMEDIAKDVSLAKAKNIPNFKCEAITGNVDDFRKFVLYLTNGKAKLTPDQWQELFSSKKINAHNKTGPAQPAEQYQLLEPWQQDAFKFMMKHTDMLNVYDGYGYDFSFVKAG
jgi:hypothetical protein